MKKINIFLLILFLSNHYYSHSMKRENFKTTPIVINSHRCDMCETYYSNLGNLNRHLKTHTKTFSCKHCGTPFARSDNLKRHIASVHNDSLLKQQQCHFCDKYISLDNFQRHIKTVHTKTYPCLQCDRYFISQQSLNVHINKYHSLIHQPPLHQLPQPVLINQLMLVNQLLQQSILINQLTQQPILIKQTLPHIEPSLQLPYTPQYLEPLFDLSENLNNKIQ